MNNNLKFYGKLINRISLQIVALEIRKKLHLINKETAEKRIDHLHDLIRHLLIIGRYE